MTDAALDGGGASAPAALPAAALNDDTGLHNNPLGSQTPVKEAPVEAPKAPATAGEAVKQALAQVKAKEAAEVKPEAAKAPVQAKVEDAKPAAERVRADDGKFAPKVAPEGAQERTEPVQAEAAKPSEGRAPYHEPPARFVPEARAEWEKVPDRIKEETYRAFQNLEQGHQKYKAEAEAWTSVKDFDELAKRNGGNLRTSLEKLNDIENTFTRDPIAGFQKVAEHFGIPLRAVAAHIMGQSPDQVQHQQDQTITDLRRELSELRQAVTSIPQQLQEREQTTAVLNDVVAFSKLPEHSRFEELSDDIEMLLTTQRASSLKEAYQLAERLNPAPAPAAKEEPLIAAETTPTAQRQFGTKPINPAGTKSIGGAPSAGNTGGSGKPKILNNRQAIEAAMQRIA